MSLLGPAFICLGITFPVPFPVFDLVAFHLSPLPFPSLPPGCKSLVSCCSTVLITSRYYSRADAVATNGLILM